MGFLTYPKESRCEVNSNGKWYSVMYYTPGEWNHAAATYDGTTCKLYLNGDYYAQFTPGQTVTGTNMSIYRNFNGYVNDLRIYDDEVLSPKVIKQLSMGMVCHYPLNREGFGSDNLLANTHFDSRYTVSGWDTTKNGTLNANSWGGYNAGVANQASVYHAHLKEFEGEYVYEFVKTANETWLGISQGAM